MQFNLADVFETVASSVPDRVALTYEGENFSYAELDAEANRTANLLAQAGISRGDHVALFLKNSVEHVTSILGLIKIRAVPINVNYRYTPAELEYIFTNSDSVAVVVELPEHQRVLASLFGACPKVKTVIVIGEVEAELVAAAKAHEVSVVSFDDAREMSPVGEFDSRSGDDVYLLYTGGTTGYPKGVMWRHDDFFRKPLSGGNPYGEEARQDLAEIASAAKEFPELSFLIAAPLMHGAALYSLFTFLTLGARVVLRREFVAEKVVEAIEKDSVQVILIVGDGMGLPLVDEMERRKDEVDFSSLFSITSGGAIWSTSVRDRMLAVKPDLLLRDNFGASESGNDGAFSIDEAGNLRMPPSPNMILVDERLEEIPAGSDDVGYIARIGNVPLGYYKDEEKTARTFRPAPTAPAFRCSATWARSKRTALLSSWVVARSASTPVARRSSPKRSRPPFTRIRQYRTHSLSPRPTRVWGSRSQRDRDLPRIRRVDSRSGTGTLPQDVGRLQGAAHDRAGR